MMPFKYHECNLSKNISVIVSDETDVSGVYTMPKRAQETAKIIKFLDDCFDSLNGGNFRSPAGKLLRGAVHSKSKHVTFWTECLQHLQNMHFAKEGTQTKFIPPSLRNLSLTIEGFLDLYSVLRNNNLRYFLPRSFNQDPLENFFGQIRLHRGRNTNPTCDQFQDSFKALMIRGMSSSHSAASNCEETFTSSLIQLHHLMMAKPKNVICSDSIVEDPQIWQMLSTLDSKVFYRPINKNAMGYVAGYIAKKVLNKFNCTYCNIHILEKSYSSDLHSFTAAKEYSDKVSLKYCNESFVKCIYNCYNITKCILANFRIEHRVRDTILVYVRHFVHFTFVCEHREQLSEFIMQFVVQLCIYNFCTGINRIMSGKESRISPQSCSLYKEAFDIHRKSRKCMR